MPIRATGNILCAGISCVTAIPMSFFQSSEPHGEETVVDDVTVLIMEEFLLLCKALQGLARGAQGWQTVFPHKVLCHGGFHTATTSNSSEDTGLIVG